VNIGFKGHNRQTT